MYFIYYICIYNLGLSKMINDDDDNDIFSINMTIKSILILIIIAFINDK